MNAHVLRDTPVKIAKNPDVQQIRVKMGFVLTPFFGESALFVQNLILLITPIKQL